MGLCAFLIFKLFNEGNMHTTERVAAQSYATIGFSLQYKTSLS